MTKETVNIHGTEYETVASRLSRFIADNPLYSIETTMEHMGDAVQSTTTIIIYSKDRAITEKSATGTAYEVKGAGNINKTSHVENAETSSVGRALAFLGYAGSEIASADEVASAISQQGKASKPQETYKRMKSKFVGTCAISKKPIKVGDDIVYNVKTKASALATAYDKKDEAPKDIFDEIDYDMEIN